MFVFHCFLTWFRRRTKSVKDFGRPPRVTHREPTQLSQTRLVFLFYIFIFSFLSCFLYIFSLSFSYLFFLFSPLLFFASSSLTPPIKDCSHTPLLFSHFYPLFFFSSNIIILLGNFIRFLLLFLIPFFANPYIP